MSVGAIRMIKSEKQKKHLLKLNRNQKRENNRHWKGGKSITNKGYVVIRIDNKYIKEHRYIMEKYLGRKLKRNEIVHHIDGNFRNNSLSNLKLIKGNGKHIKKEHLNKWKRNKLGRFIKSVSHSGLFLLF